MKTMLLRRRRHRRGNLVLLVLLPFITLVLAVFIPGPISARRYAEQRECYSMQKEIAGAVEMYLVDEGWTATSTTVTTPIVDEAFLHRLVEQGYLKSMPRDPGGPSSNTYVSLPPPVSGRLCCLRHGVIMVPDGVRVVPGSARRELEGMGVTDAALLTRALDEPTSEAAMRFSRHVLLALCFVWVVVLAKTIVDFVGGLVGRGGKETAPS